jgi:release factor glutamine methyltransferase
MIDIFDLIRDISTRLEKIHDDPIARQQDAWWIAQALTKKTEADLIALKKIKLSDKQTIQLEQWLDAHINEHKPLQYILGFVPFNDLKILVEPPILIPRPETEEWAFNLAQKLKSLSDKNIAILDACCGTGCIALSLARVSPLAIVQGTDISEHAIQLSKKNALHNRITNTSFIHADLFPQNNDVKYDLIVSNPPYIPESEWSNLNPSITQWEDKKALISGKDGLDCIRGIIKNAKQWLKHNNEMKEKDIPQLVIEIDSTQGDAVKTLLEKAGFINVEILKDLEGKNRVAYAGLQ